MNTNSTPIDTAVAQRLRRERGLIVENFKNEFFGTNNSTDPLAQEKRRFTQTVGWR